MSSPEGGTRRRLDRAFYAGMAVAATATVFVGFAPTYYLRSRFETTSLPAYLRVHGLVFTAWILLFLVQTALVAARRTSVHRRLGWAGAALAACVVAVGITAGILSGRGHLAAGVGDEVLSFLTTPFSSMLVFLLLTAAAVRSRRRPETHKRLMLLATISLLDAPIARWPVPGLAASAWASLALTDAFILAGVAYDLWSRGRVHPAYLWGGLAIVAGQLSRDPVGGTAAWMAFARAVLTP